MHDYLLEKNTLKNKACIFIDDIDKVNQFDSENKSLKEKVDKLNMLPI